MGNGSCFFPHLIFPPNIPRQQPQLLHDPEAPQVSSTMNNSNQQTYPEPVDWSQPYWPTPYYGSPVYQHAGAEVMVDDFSYHPFTEAFDMGQSAQIPVDVALVSIDVLETEL
jgi:hypothetical protein